MSTVSGSAIKRVVVACEAGMGSSVMVAKMLAKQLKEHGVDVTHAPVNQLAASNPDVVLCHRGLSVRAKQAVPDIVVVAFDMFLGDPRIQSIVTAVVSGTDLSDD